MAFRALVVVLVCALLTDGARVAKKKSGKHEDGCPPVQTQPNFNLTSYISKRWYTQQQMTITYLPADANNCVTAEYSLKSKATWLGWTITVDNKAQYDNGEPRGGQLCAAEADATDPAKLQVAPCFVPVFASGPYWVLAHNEAEGYALVSGGQPTIKTEGGCQTGTGVNDSGLWIFTREAFPSEALVAKVRDIAKSQGFDLSVLVPVKHAGCTGE